MNGNGQTITMLKNKGTREAIMMINSSGLGYGSVKSRNMVICPTLPFSEIGQILEIIHGNLEDCGYGIKRGKIYQPSETQAPEYIQRKLRHLKEYAPINDLKFPTDCIDATNYDKPFQKRDNDYIEIDGNLYLVLVTNSYYNGKEFDGITYTNGNYVAYPVEEKYIYIDEQKGIAIAEDSNITGVPYNHEGVYYKDISRLDIGKFLRAYTKHFYTLQQVMKERQNAVNLSNRFSNLLAELQKEKEKTCSPRVPGREEL